MIDEKEIQPGAVIPINGRRVRKRFEGIALAMDVVKKISYQLERLPPTQVAAVIQFVEDWGRKRPLIPGLQIESNGQLPLATDESEF